MDLETLKNMPREIDVREVICKYLADQVMAEEDKKLIDTLRTMCGYIISISDLKETLDALGVEL